MELADTSIKRQKHLGQYFSGPLVASLLAYLAKHDEAKSIIDPMCGTGDMLMACNPTGNPDKKFVGVEIDGSVSEYAHSRFSSASNVHIANSSAFDKDLLKGITSSEFDLVITNPPYVRYQTIAESKFLNKKSQSTSEIKQNLLSALLCHSNLPLREKDIFKSIISNYSGLADLAVPSWILCALLVKHGGRIAMVVPQTWLNRDYSEAIHYLLVKLFRIEFIIEDANSVWFPDAQVKTTLLIARRIEVKESILHWDNESFTYCRIFSSSISQNSLVGQVFPGSTNPEKEFYSALKSNQSNDGHFASQHVSIKHFARDAGKRLQNTKWFNLLEPNIDRLTLKTAYLKPSSLLSEWLEGATPELSSLQELGINVSQGLRTGANTFFYFKLCSESPEGAEAIPSKNFFQSPIPIPSGSYRKVITKQSEVSEPFSTANLKPSSVVLYLQEAVAKEDYETYLQKDLDLKEWYAVLPDELSRHIKIAETINVGTIENPKRYPQLSAVSPNVRQWNQLKPNTPPRFWYMLPKFTDRHRPDLFVPRVNNLHPQTRLNYKQGFVIDANFSSLWLGKNTNGHTLHSLLAVLNSSWVHIAMEEFGTAMGGGALKLEATQLKKLPIPRFTSIEIEKLDSLGLRLALPQGSYKNVLTELDNLIVSKMGFEANLTKKLNEMDSIKQKLLNYRQS